MDKLKAFLLRHKVDLDVDSPAADTWEYIGPKISDEPASTGTASNSAFPVRPGFFSRVVRYAAAVCVIVLAGAGLWLVVKNNKMVSDTAKHDGGPVKSGPAPGTERTRNGKAGNGRAGNGKAGNGIGEEKTSGKNMARNAARAKRARHKSGLPKPMGTSDQVAVIDKSYSSLIDEQLRKIRATPLWAENGSYFSFYTEQFKQMDRDEQTVRNDIKRYGLTSQLLDQLINVNQQKLNVLKDLQTEVNKMNNKVREKQSPAGKPEVHYLNI